MVVGCHRARTTDSRHDVASAIPECKTVNWAVRVSEAPPRDYYSTDHESRLFRLIKILGTPGLFAHHAPRRFLYAPAGSLDSLWQSDSLTVEWDLAYLAVSPAMSSMYLGESAAGKYRSWSGRAGPILHLIDETQTDARRAMALAAITDSLNEQEEEVLFRMSCDAAWLLAAWNIDTAYSGIAFRTVSWPADAADVLREATRLAKGKRRTAIVDLAERFHMRPEGTLYNPPFP